LPETPPALGAPMSTEPETTSVARGSPWRRLLRFLTSPLVRVCTILLLVAFWARAIASSWEQARTYPWHIGLPLLVLSFASLSLHMLGLAFTWSWLLKRLGQTISTRAAVRIWLTSQFARYLPGPAWDAWGRLGIGARAGLDFAAASLSIVLEMAAGVLAYIALVLLSLPFWPDASRLGYLRYAPFLLPLGLIALYPPLFNWSVNLALRLVHRPTLTVRLPLTTVMLLFCQEFAWRLVEALGLLFLAEALVPGSAHLAALLVGAQAAAWLIGFFAVFVPAGIGVREGAFAFLLAPVLPIAIGTAIALAFRLLCGLRDLLALLAASLLRRP